MSVSGRMGVHTCSWKRIHVLSRQGVGLNFLVAFRCRRFPQVRLPTHWTRSHDHYPYSVPGGVFSRITLSRLSATAPPERQLVHPTFDHVPEVYLSHPSSPFSYLRLHAPVLIINFSLFILFSFLSFVILYSYGGAVDMGVPSTSLSLFPSILTSSYSCSLVRPRLLWGCVACNNLGHAKEHLISYPSSISDQAAARDINPTTHRTL